MTLVGILAVLVVVALYLFGFALMRAASWAPPDDVPDPHPSIRIVRTPFDWERDG